MLNKAVLNYSDLQNFIEFCKSENETCIIQYHKNKAYIYLSRARARTHTHAHTHTRTLSLSLSLSQSSWNYGGWPSVGVRNEDNIRSLSVDGKGVDLLGPGRELE